MVISWGLLNFIHISGCSWWYTGPVNLRDFIGLYCHFQSQMVDCHPLPTFDSRADDIPISSLPKWKRKAFLRWFFHVDHYCCRLHTIYCRCWFHLVSCFFSQLTLIAKKNKEHQKLDSEKLKSKLQRKLMVPPMVIRKMMGRKTAQPNEQRRVRWSQRTKPP